MEWVVGIVWNSHMDLAFVPSIWESHPYTLVSAAFLHLTFQHFAFNMSCFLLLGAAIEQKIMHGRIVIATLYILSAAIGFLCKFALDPTRDLPGLGASGAVAGIMGAYLLLFPRVRRSFVGVCIMLWFSWQLWQGIDVFCQSIPSGPAVAVWGHIGGFVAGALFVAVIPATKPSDVRGIHSSRC